MDTDTIFIFVHVICLANVALHVRLGKKKDVKDINCCF